MAEIDDRKKRMMEHIARSTGAFFKRPTVTTASNDRKQYILDHVRRTRG